MTRYSQWIASHFLFLPLAIIVGCQTAPQKTALNPKAAADEAQDAAALQQLERTSSVAIETIKSIDMARDVVMNNLSNAETTAFKATRPILQEGGKLRTQLDFSQGSLNTTGRPLDVGIQGEGMFKVKIGKNTGDGFGYTRNGNFFINDVSELLVGLGDGYPLSPAIKVPAGATNITISQDGLISVIMPGGTSPRQIGQLKLIRFVNPEGLNQLPDGIYEETVASGPPNGVKPGEGGSGSLLQNFLEQSNVNLTQEMAHLKFLNRWRADLLQAMGMEPEKI